ncbi:hypothetical protein WJX72_005665 [[Myrmecia] bisecta]|uniref:Uncharacterized protein n=1 Tax=[Myrmecia] bisecta TaxID=41462 RepID=A0AAW1QQK1_9CHLO
MLSLLRRAVASRVSIASCLGLRSAGVARCFAWTSPEVDRRKAEQMTTPEELEAAQTERELWLLQTSKKLDATCNTKDTKPWDDIAADVLTLHKDGLTVEDDIVGLDDVKKYLKSYWDQREYTHKFVCAGVHEGDNVCFTYWLDEGNKPKQVDSSYPDWAKQPTNITGIMKYAYDPNTSKLVDIYLLRQLAADEQYKKLKQSVEYGKAKVDLSLYSAPPKEISKTRHDEMARTAPLYSKIWATGDPQYADQAMMDDVRYLDETVPREVKGREQFKEMIKETFKHWESIDNMSWTAPTYGNKTFIHWTDEGVHKDTGQRDSLYGLTILRYDYDMISHIKEAVEFRQLLSTERQQMLRSEA